MARKRRKKRRWLSSLILFVMTPLIVWALAFLVWLYWYDITGLFGPSDNIPAAKTSKEIERSTQPSEKSAQEGIREEDRKKLEEILRSKR